jgi:hypothetical protein
MRKVMRAAAAVLVGLSVFLITGCGGGGAGEGEQPTASLGTAPVPPAQPAPTGPAGDAAAAPVAAPESPAPPVPSTSVTGTLFLGDNAHAVITVMPNPSSGAVPELLEARFVQTTSPVTVLAYDSKRDILYGRRGTPSGEQVLAFSAASRMSGTASPSRTITLPGDVVFIGALHIDEENDVLYVEGARSFDSQLLVFNNASETASVAPTRIMPLGTNVMGTVIDTGRGTLYALQSGGGIRVYTGLHTPRGLVLEERRVEPFLIGSVLALDAARDRLYVGDVFSRVKVIPGISQPGAQVTVSLDIPSVLTIAVDTSNDRLYVSAYDTVYVLDNASNLATGMSVRPSIVATKGTAFGAFAFP